MSLDTNKLRGKISAVPSIDRTLSKDGKCAESKKTGDEIKRLDARIDSIVTPNAKSIKYDNTGPGLPSNVQNVQDAITTLANAQVSIADYPVEVGESDGFSYTKWKSGRVEAHGKKTIPLIFNESLKNNLWKGIPTNPADMTDTIEGANNTFVPFPKDASGKILFKSAEYANIISSEYSRGIVRTVQLLSLPLERNGFVFFVTKDFGSTPNATAENVTLYFHVIGSWKE